MTGRLNESEVAKAEHMEIEDYFDKAVLTQALAKASNNDEDNKKNKKKIAKKTTTDAADDDNDTAAVGGKFYSFAYVYNKLVVAIITARVQPSSDNKQEIKLLGWSTLKRYRNTGLGHDLLTLLLKTIKEEEEAGVVVVTAETISGHAPAEKLLRRAGFELKQATKLAGLRGTIYGIERREWTLTI